MPNDEPNDRPPGATPAEPLSVRVDGSRGEPTRVYVLSPPRGGRVDVREFRAGCAPVEYTATTGELVALFERAHGERRGMSESLYGIRLWLNRLNDRGDEERGTST